MSEYAMLAPRVMGGVPGPPSIGDASQVVMREWIGAASQFYGLVTWRDYGIRVKFDMLAEQWRRECAYTSSLSDLVAHKAYQRIVALGWDVVPILLRELEHRPDHWFWALKVITGFDPVPPEHRGDLQRMAEDWLNWAREQGHRW